MLIAPLRDQLSVLHMRLGIRTAELDPGELNHYAVAYIIGILGFISFFVRQYAELDQLRVCAIVKAEEVSAGLLKGRAVLAEGIW